MNDERTRSSSGGLLKIVLLALLFVVLGMFVYDQFVAKASYAAANKTLDEMHTLKPGSELDAEGRTIKSGDVDGDGVITSSDVESLLEREPSSETVVGETGMFQTYSWARGIPGQSYTIYVLYNKFQDQEVFYSVKDEEPTEENFRKKPTIPELGSVPSPASGGPAPPTSGGSDDKGAADDDDDKKEDDKKSDDKKEEQSDPDGDEGSGN